MKKKLILFRHGKSDWQTDARDDHARPLAERGIRDAGKMGRFLASTGQLPDHVLCSTAVRARSSLELARVHWSPPPTLRYDERLYGASEEMVLDIVRALPDTAGTVMLVGHDPVTSSVTSQFIGGGRIAYPTAAMGCIHFEIETWQEVVFGAGELAWFVRPRLFPEQ